MIYFKNGAVSENQLDRKPDFQLSAYEEEALNFCRTWKAGKQSFAFETSGSTGIPKAIVLKRETMERSAQRTQKALRLSKGESAFVCLNVKYIAGQMMLVRGLEIGMDMTIVEPASMPLEEVDPGKQFDFISLVPLQMMELLKHPETCTILDKAKNILLGGATVNEELSTGIQALSSNVYATFGMTETASHIALRLLNGPGKSKSYFTVEGIQVRQDDRGCLVIIDVLAKEEFVTNDLVELISEKEFIWIGRIDNIINSGGIKVAAEQIETEVETVFRKLQLARRFFVCGLPDKRLGEMVGLIIEGSPLSYETEQHIKTQLSQVVANYNLPKKIIYTPNILTTNSKVDRLGTRKLLIS